MLGLVVLLLVAGLQFGDADTYTDNYQRALTALRENCKQECESAVFRDCCQAKIIVSSMESGRYEIKDACTSVFGAKMTLYARCDMETNGGGWLVIQRRVSGGTENFYRSWEEYENGFGNLNGEFWYGLKNIHCLSTQEQVELQIEVKQNDGTGVTWTYQVFKVEGPDTNYILRIGEGQGTSSHDAMAYHNNRPFSTYDQDHDIWSGGNCAQSYRGGWWYHNCYHTNLNGPHAITGINDQIKWGDGTTLVYFPNVEMKIRPKSCLPT